MTERAFTQQSNDYQRVEQAIRFLAANYRRHPSLDEVAASVHLSKYHFQRLFKRWAGISPAQFLQYLTIEYAKERLREARSILDVTLDAGLSSPGRLHDLFVTFEALTPGEYKRGGAGLEVRYGYHDTPFGTCLLAMTERGICGLQFVQEDDPDASFELLMGRWPRATFLERPDATQPYVDRAFAPLSSDGTRPFHLLLKGTNFQVNVWRALLAIPSGAMVSYEDIATLIGRPKATRAVGNAVGGNPIAYLIPCHRVISKAGAAHRYRYGSARKKAMLGWEASHRRQDEAGR
jgi:AraC family transcriptional regulator of adaptative response/methylated-DNA-[protein]-cysteine methyltransferase